MSGINKRIDRLMELVAAQCDHKPLADTYVIDDEASRQEAEEIHRAREACPQCRTKKLFVLDISARHSVVNMDFLAAERNGRGFH